MFCRRTKGQVREFSKEYALMKEETDYASITIEHKLKANYDDEYLMVMRVFWDKIKQVVTLSEITNSMSSQKFLG